MKALLFVANLLVVLITNAQVGIGTNTPSTNAVLDVSSSDKGIMLPRLNDTSNVTNPSAGLMIFNMGTLTPAFHDGSRWNTLATPAGSAAANADSITYTITNANGGFTNGTYDIIAIPRVFQTPAVPLQVFRTQVL